MRNYFQLSGDSSSFFRYAVFCTARALISSKVRFVKVAISSQVSLPETSIRLAISIRSAFRISRHSAKLPFIISVIRKIVSRRLVLKRLRNHQKKIVSQGKGQPQQEQAEEMEQKKK